MATYANAFESINRIRKYVAIRFDDIMSSIGYCNGSAATRTSQYCKAPLHPPACPPDLAGTVNRVTFAACIYPFVMPTFLMIGTCPPTYTVLPRRDRSCRYMDYG